MKNDLTCGVVRDLLPSYVENLLGEESREAVDRHLETCPACTAQKEAMAARTGPEPEEAAKEVDYLRRVKKGTVKKIVLAVVCTALVLLGGAALKLFVIGTPLQAQSVAVLDEGMCSNNSLALSLISTNSGSALYGWKVETVDGVASIYARDVLASPLHSSGLGYLEVPLEGVREVWLGGTSGQGRLIWAEGTIIDKETLDLLDAKAPYCGDAPALGNIAKLLRVGDRIGRYNISLQTSERPYRWTLEFEDAEETTSATWGMSRFLGYQMLALVENLDEVSFRYPSSSGVFTAELASASLARLTEEYNAEHATSWPVHESIKEYAESPLEYQRLVTLLEIMFVGTSGTTVTVVKP